MLTELLATLEPFVMQHDVHDLYMKYESELDADLRADELTTVHYFYMREHGQSPRFAAMAACNHPPGTGNGDREFNEHARARMYSMPKANMKRILDIAKKAGVNTQGKYYVGGLGRYNEQKAWVSTTDDINAVVSANPHLTVDGVVKQTGRKSAPPAKVPLANDIVHELQKAYLKDPKERESARKRNGMQALREKIIAKHGAKK